MTASTDPTLQTKGTLTVGLKLDYNASFINSNQRNGMAITAGPITYAPANQPPPPWTNRTQYQTGNGTAFGAMGLFPPPNPTFYSGQDGIYSALRVMDMSSNTVLPGKSYAFTFALGSNWIQLYVRIAGGPDGSTVLPGFGLWSLGSNPHAWSYLTPEQFTGDWMIGLHSPSSFNTMWLSAEYAPPKDYGGGYLQARLTFTVAGLFATTGYQLTSPDEAGAPVVPGVLKPTDVQHLHARSHPHILHRGPGVPVE